MSFLDGLLLDIAPSQQERGRRRRRAEDDDYDYVDDEDYVDDDSRASMEQFCYGGVDLSEPLSEMEPSERKKRAGFHLLKTLLLVGGKNSTETFFNMAKLLPGKLVAACAKSVSMPPFVAEMAAVKLEDDGRFLLDSVEAILRNTVSNKGAMALLSASGRSGCGVILLKRLLRAFVLNALDPDLVSCLLVGSFTNVFEQDFNAIDQWSVSPDCVLLADIAKFAQRNLGEIVVVMKIDQKAKNWRKKGNGWAFLGVQFIGKNPPAGSTGSSVEWCLATSAGSATETGSQLSASVARVGTSMRSLRGVPSLVSFDAKALMIVTGCTYEEMWPANDKFNQIISPLFPFTWGDIYICVMHFHLRVLSYFFGEVFKVLFFRSFALLFHILQAMISRSKDIRSQDLACMIALFKSCGGSVLENNVVKVSDGNFDRKFFIDREGCGLSHCDLFLQHVLQLCPEKFRQGYAELFASMGAIVNTLHLDFARLNSRVFDKFDSYVGKLHVNLVRLFPSTPQLQKKPGLYLPMLLDGRLCAQMRRLFCVHRMALIQVSFFCSSPFFV